MSFSFRPAVRENVNLLIGLAGGTGSGKSFSAMRLASGLAGGKPFCVLDSENRRALHYADAFKFDHASLVAPFRPAMYAEAIEAADAAGYSVIVVDQMSYEHSGEGGLLDWQEEELTRMAGDDYKKRESCKMASWIKPKMAHKHMMQKLLQVRAHLILCFRAEAKIEMVRSLPSLQARAEGGDGKWQIVPKQSLTGLDGWIPISEKNLPFELTTSFLLTADAPGIPKPIKLQQQHKALFPLDKPLTEESGRLIAQWAAGAPSAQSEAASVQFPTQVAGGFPKITDKQAADIESLCTSYGVPVAALKKAAKVAAVADILAVDFSRTLKWIDAARKTREKAA